MYNLSPIILKVLVSLAITVVSSVSLGSQKSSEIEVLEQEIEIMVAELNQKVHELKMVDSQISMLDAEIERTHISSIAANK